MAISWSYVHSLLTFVKKDVIPPFLKKTQLVVLHIYFFHIFLKDATLPPSHPPPGYPPSGFPPGYLMLPNLTNQFIKLSDGNLQCEWNSDIFETILIVDEVWVHFSFSFLIVWSTDFFCYSNIWCWEFSDSLAIYEALYNSYLVSQPILILCCWICWLKQMFNINAVNVLNICWQLYGGTAKHKVTYLYLSATYI